MSTPARIPLSVPHMSGEELAYVHQAFETNWLSTVGPHIPAFEAEFESLMGMPSVAVASGTAALHLGLRLLGVVAGDIVLCSTLTFVASANAIRYLGAEPVFIDSDRQSWTMNPDILAEALQDLDRKGKRPKAAVVVDIYGQPADMDPITRQCENYGVRVLDDAAEALGALYKGRPVGQASEISVFSFNGNKIITTTGGGMLCCRDRAAAERARAWSQQARKPGISYEHSELGYNYRMSNVLAGIGRGQFAALPLRVRQRRAIAFRYQAAFADLPGLRLMPQAPYAHSTYWLSCFTVDPTRLGISRDRLIELLGIANIEARPVWKPMHMQPLYIGATVYGGAVAECLHRDGICLPSSSSLSETDQLRIINTIRTSAGANALDALSVAHLGEEQRQEAGTRSGNEIEK